MNARCFRGNLPAPRFPFANILRYEGESTRVKWSHLRPDASHAPWVIDGAWNDYRRSAERLSPMRVVSTDSTLARKSSSPVPTAASWACALNRRLQATKRAPPIAAADQESRSAAFFRPFRLHAFWSAQVSNYPASMWGVTKRVFWSDRRR